MGEKQYNVLAHLTQEGEPMSEMKIGKIELPQQVTVTHPTSCVHGEAACYIAKLEEYVEFLTVTNEKNAVFLLVHGMGDSTKDIDKGQTLRKEIDELRKTI